MNELLAGARLLATTTPPTECELLEVATDAAARGLFLITDGRETKISPIVPPGWHRMAVRVKEAA